MRKLLVAVILLAVFAIVGCGESNQKKTDNSEMPALKTLSVDALDKLKAEHKGKVMLVNFFASWCPPCRGETPEFVKVYNEYKDKGFVIVGLSVDDKSSDAVKYMNEFGVKYPVFMADASLQQRYGITTIPTNLVYSPEGEMLDLIVGPVSEKYLVSMISKYKK